MSLVSGSKGHHGVKRASNYHPWMLNMTTCTDHQLFIFGEKLWIFLSGWVCWKLEICRSSLFSRSNLDWVGERGDLQGLNIASTPTFLDWTFHYYSFGNSRCTPCAHNDGLWYVRGVSKMCRCAGQQLNLDDLLIPIHFITTYIYRYINIYLKNSKDTLLDAVHGVLSFWSSWRQTLWQINDLGALEMSLLTLQHVFNLSSLLTIITRLLERIRQFWEWRPGRFCK